ncbi:MAG: hypothetical protein HC820_05555 [Hydrococcus sp. RM1_1_31]|nr:hypothetical protein [Hydrococcus sp. RM1_1_31]
MLQPSTLKLKVCKFLKLGIRDVAEVQEWANCLFVRFRKGYKFFVRFVSKKALVTDIPQESGLYWVTIAGKKLLMKLTITSFEKSALIDLFHCNNKQALGSIEVFKGSLVRAFFKDELLPRCELRAIDFEPYHINTNLTLRSTSKAYVPLGSLA